jgi:hypothetical protein
MVCHQVLQPPSEYGTSSMGKYLLAKAHLPELNDLKEEKVTELTNSMVVEMTWDILKTHESRPITIICSEKNFIFHI